MSACVTTPPSVQPDLSAAQHLPRQVELADVPFFAQSAYQCGPAALAMTLNQRGAGLTPDVLVDRVYLPERKGSLQVEMVAAARSFGFLVYPLPTELAALLEALAAGHAVLVLQNLGLDWLPQWHYAVAVGYDLDAQTLILHSGLEEQLQVPFDVFQMTWQRGGSWARLVLPPDQLPPSPEPLVYLRAASDLEQTGQLTSALRAYRLAAQRWPDQPAALLGQGNVAWQQERRVDAVLLFQELAQRFPEVDAGWINLEVSLRTLGCDDAAQQVRKLATVTPQPSATLESEVQSCLLSLRP